MIFQSVAKKEDCSIPQRLAQRIAEKSGRNLRRAILMAEACKVQQPQMTANQVGIDVIIYQHCGMVKRDSTIEKQSPL